MSSEQNCTRHAFTDGECKKAGCKDCPAELYKAELSERKPHAMDYLLVTLIMAGGATIGYQCIELAIFVAKMFYETAQ